MLEWNVKMKIEIIKKNYNAVIAVLLEMNIITFLNGKKKMKIKIKIVVAFGGYSRKDYAHE